MAVVKKPDHWVAKDGTRYSRHTMTGVMFKLGYVRGFSDEHAVEYAQYLQELERIANPAITKVYEPTKR